MSRPDYLPAHQTEDLHRHLPPGHTHRDTPTPPSPVLSAVPVRQVSSQTSDMGGLYTSPQAVGSSSPRFNSGRVMSAASTSTDPLPYNHATSNLTTPPALRTAPTAMWSSTDDVFANRIPGNIAIVTHPSAPPPNNAHPPHTIQNRPHPSVAQEPDPSMMHAQHTWNHSPNLAKSRANRNSQQDQPPSPLSNPTSHEFPPSQPHPHETLQPHPLGSSQPHPVLSAVPGLLNPRVQHESPRQLSSVHVQLEPELTDHSHSSAGHSHSSAGYSHSSAGYSIAGATATVAAAVGDNTTGYHQSQSYPSLMVQTDSSPIVRPVAYSHSSANVPTLPSNLHVCLSRSQPAPPSGGRVDVPDIKVEIPGDTISQMRRLGHSRHLSLGRNVTAPQQRPTHSRHRSLGSINPSQITPLSTVNSAHGSCSNLSMMSNASICGSDISAASNFLTASQLARLPDSNKGYDFAQHFNLFSQYTSNMALEYCVSGRGSEEHLPAVPPVWCMAFCNRVVTVGCSNGQLEVSGWGREGGSKGGEVEETMLFVLAVVYVMATTVNTSVV